MKKAELIEAVAANSGLSKADSGRALESFVETVSKALKKGDEVSIRGFGKFSVARRSAGGSHRKRATPAGLGIEASFVSAASRSKQGGSPRGTSSSSRGRSRHAAGEVFDDELRSLLGDDVSPDLAVARRAARWALAEQAWEQRLEAIWDARDVARALDVSKQRVSVLVRKHRLIALPQNGRLRFPVWQFAGLDGADRACLAQAHDVLVSEGQIDPWSAASWFLAGHPDLEGRAPVQWLRDGGGRDLLLTAACRDAARARQ